jgi:hypothetical protein
MIQIADEPLHFYHKIGFTSSESMAIFIENVEKYGVECDDINLDHNYCEALLSSEGPLSVHQMADIIVLSGEVCHVILNSVVPTGDL